MKHILFSLSLFLIVISESDAQFWAKSNGRFGIGDENAFAKLQVNATSSFSNPGIALLDSSATNASGGILQFRSINWDDNHFNIQAKIGEYAFGQDSKLDFFFRENLIMSIEGGSSPDRQLVYNPRDGIFRTGLLNPGSRGQYSVAMGYNNLASGNNSVALGGGNQALTEGTTALGGGSTAAGTYSTVIGYNNYAPGPFSLAAGKQCTAYELNAVAIGDSAVATGASSHAIGYKTLASAHSSTATGHLTDATGLYSFSGGYATQATNTSSTAFGFVSKATGVSASAFGYNTLAAGENSVAFNSETKAFGNNALSSGYATKAHGWESSAFGNNTTTRSYVSAVFGAYNDTIATSVPDTWVSKDPLLMVGNGVSNAERNNAFTIFKNGIILAKNPSTVTSDPGPSPLPATGAGTRLMWLPERSAFRVGTVDNNSWNADSIGFMSFASGFNSRATGTKSNSLGDGTRAEGYASTSMGYNTQAVGDVSTAMGNSAEAIGVASSAIGSLVLATGGASTAIGYNTHAKGEYSTALGTATIAGGRGSGAMGSYTVASGDYSMAIGFHTDARAYGSTSMGAYNDSISLSSPTSWVGTDPLIMVGNGTDDANRHNAFTIYKNGSILAKNPTPVIFSGATDPPVSGAGTRMMWIPERSAFRAGTVENDEWDSGNIGLGSFASGINCKASGYYAIALGSGTQSTSNNTMAVGENSSATGINSFAVGTNALSSGVYACSMGITTTASGHSSLATGNGTTASGLSSTAMGNFTQATGLFSTSMGKNTKARAFASTAIGYYNNEIPGSSMDSWVETDPLFMIGNGPNEFLPHNALTVYKNGNLLMKYHSLVEVDPGVIIPPANWSGTRMMWLQDKSAFRVGTVTNNSWNAENLGTWSFASGFNPKASGAVSTSIGSNTIASGTASTALGFETFAFGDYATALGHNTLASGPRSTAMGTGTEASGNYSTAMGSNTRAIGAVSTAMGYNNEASGNYAIAMGNSTFASGHQSMAMGFNTHASGDASMAVGSGSLASGWMTSALGRGLKAKAFASTTIGSYNDEIAISSETTWEETDPILIVGNGEFGFAPSNAMVVYKNGNTDINGYTRLGEESESAPRIKMKELPLTTAGVNYNSSKSIPHGLSVSKILSVSVLIEWDDNFWAPPEYSPSLNLRYNYYVGPSNIVVQNNTPSGDCLICERPVKITITYKE